jgi:hypothetical protein
METLEQAMKSLKFIKVQVNILEHYALLHIKLLLLMAYNNTTISKKKF